MSRESVGDSKALVYVVRYFFFLFCARARQPPPPVGQGLLIHKISISHTTTHYSRWDFSGRVISSSQRPLPDNIQNTHNRQTSMPPVVFEPAISGGERRQNYSLDRAATGTGRKMGYCDKVLHKGKGKGWGKWDSIICVRNCIYIDV